MELIIPSFLAGVLTVLAPCVLALLPVIIGGTAGETNRWRPVAIALALGVSVIIFTLLLKASTVLIGVPQSFWQAVAGGLVTIFGITMVFPSLWEKLSFKLKLYKSEELIEKNKEKSGIKGAILLGASLGPVFTTCSPTYALIIAIVLPNDIATGLLSLTAYATGLMLLILLIGFGGQSITMRFKGLSNPRGWFKRSLGVLLVITGIAIVTGLDKRLETYILDKGYLGPIEIEQELTEGIRERFSQ